MSINKAILIGNLGKDPEIRFLPNGRSKCELRVATNEKWTDKEGHTQERVDWHRVAVWGKQADVCKQYLAKGRQVYVEGKIHTSQYEKNGEKRWSTEIVADLVRFLGRGSGAGRDESPRDAPAPSEMPPGDLPF